MKLVMVAMVTPIESPFFADHDTPALRHQLAPWEDARRAHHPASNPQSCTIKVLELNFYHSRFNRHSRLDFSTGTLAFITSSHYFMGAPWIPNRFQAALFTRPKAIDGKLVLISDIGAP